MTLRIEAKYKDFLFDFDGVIANSNRLKEDAIRRAVGPFCDDRLCNEFVKFFVQGNGIPREIKVNEYFDSGTAGLILKAYASELADTSSSVDLIPGVADFISVLNSNSIRPIILSGGNIQEIRSVLDRHDLTNSFSDIFAGPKTKDQNFSDHIKGSDNLIYFGDSLSDFKFAQRFSIDFIFIYGYTQFENWKEFFETRMLIGKAPDFTDVCVDWG